MKANKSSVSQKDVLREKSGKKKEKVGRGRAAVKNRDISLLSSKRKKQSRSFELLKRNNNSNSNSSKHNRSHDFRNNPFRYNADTLSIPTPAPHPSTTRTGSLKALTTTISKQS